LAIVKLKSMRSKSALASLSMLAFLAGCQGGVDSFFPKEKQPLPAKLMKSIKAKGMTTTSPIMIRLFKEESALEVWKAKDTGRYELLKTYDICRWSGKLGPKFKEGDRQAPEGFYTVAPGQMNPKSSYYLSFNMGFPNTFDRSRDRTGTFLMIHGACSSAGCYSMTDEQIGEIYAMARDSFKGGQKKFQIQAFPFRMTPENMVRNENSEYYEFWKMLKKGSDYFEVAKKPPKVDVCDKNYVFNRQVEDGVRFKSRAACPQSTVPERLEMAYFKKAQADEMEMAKIKGKIEKKKQLDILLGRTKTPKESGPGQSLAAIDQTVTASNVPEQRPALTDEEQPIAKKKFRGLFSWLKRN